MEGIVIREMTIGDYPRVYELWAATEGVGLGPADSREGIGRMLARNAGCSFVAERDGREIVGALLCGHDGRRGCLYHLAVSPGCRKGGLGRGLVESCLAKLREAGIGRCHLHVFPDNRDGTLFWRHLGFNKRDDLHLFSIDP